MVSSSLWTVARGVAATAARAKTASTMSSPLLALTSVRCIAGKAMRADAPPRPKPFNYEKWEYNMFWSLFMWERTTLRFDENTKVICVEGAHAVGKTKFAQELAEELDMKFFPKITMDDWYRSPYGVVDLRDYSEYFMPRVRPYDEKDFFRDPTGPVHGSCDRMLLGLYMKKFERYILALRHLFNTGQGVVLEFNPFSDYCYLEAAYNAGWVERISRAYIKEQYLNTLHLLLRPNLLLYLDAPADVVQKKVAARNNEWDKDSPVWANTEYLNDIYGLMKKDYLKKAQPHSHVLVYDWSEPGDTEIVVEDIEKLNFDYYGQFEEPQKDWRLHNDEETNVMRLKYSRHGDFVQMKSFMCKTNTNYAEELFWSAEEANNFDQVCRWLPHHNYGWGFNSDAGDKGVLFKTTLGKNKHSDKDWPHIKQYKILRQFWEKPIWPKKSRWLEQGSGGNGDEPVPAAAAK